MNLRDYVLPMARLFTGNARFYGQWHPVTNRSITVKDAINDELFVLHLEGNLGLGICPVMDDGDSWFGAIDLDNHGPNGRALDIFAIARRAVLAKLPLVSCRSKSGGLHLYHFLSKPVPAFKIRATLSRYAIQLGFPSAEIFPKQDRISGEGEDRGMGGWINLPYFNVAETGRHAIINDEPASIEEFFELAESIRNRTSILTAKVTVEDETSQGLLSEVLLQGPPCLERIMQEKLEEGGRNEALYQAAVMLKKANITGKPMDVTLSEFSSQAFNNPLTAREIAVVGRSVTKKDNYFYKCKSSPFLERCDKVLCKSRKFGVRSGDDIFNDVPRIERIVRCVGEGTTWRIYIEGVPSALNMATEELTEYKKLTARVFEATLKVLAPMKQSDWQLQLAMVMRDPNLQVETETGVSLTDIFRRDIIEFVKRANREDKRDEIARRADILRGMPAFCANNGSGGAYAFKDTALVDWLQKRRKLMGSRTDNYNRLRDALGDGAKGKIEIEGKEVEVWWVPPSIVDDQDIPPREYRTDY